MSIMNRKSLSLCLYVVVAAIFNREMILETPRLILRPFRKEDLDLLAPLMANPDFMRFSLGV